MRYELTEYQWTAIKPMLPNKPRGVPRVNDRPLPAGGLKRSQIVTTGTCTTPIPLQTGAYVADFGKLGMLQLNVTA